MKTTASTIRVNPASSTLGSLNPEALRPAISMLRCRIIPAHDESALRARSGRKLRLFFGRTATEAPRGRMLLASRILFGAFLIMHGILSLRGVEIAGMPALSVMHTVPVFGIISIAVGAMLSLGLFSRFAMCVGAATAASVSALALGAGLIPQTNLLITIVCIIMAMSGPGRYSFDALLKRSIFRRMKRREARRDRFDYRAMHREN